MTTSGHAADDTDARTGQKGYLMDTVDITPTPEACRQIARLFRARQADAEALAARAEYALDNLDTLDDDTLAPWGRALLVAAFEALYEAEGARALKVREGVEALGPYAATGGEGSDVAA